MIQALLLHLFAIQTSLMILWALSSKLTKLTTTPLSLHQMFAPCTNWMLSGSSLTPTTGFSQLFCYALVYSWHSADVNSSKLLFSLWLLLWPLSSFFCSSTHGSLMALTKTGLDGLCSPSLLLSAYSLDGYSPDPLWKSSVLPSSLDGVASSSVWLSTSQSFTSQANNGYSGLSILDLPSFVLLLPSFSSTKLLWFQLPSPGPTCSCAASLYLQADTPTNLLSSTKFKKEQSTN